jgi:OOP family OmpA-OmpF porin
MTMRLAYLALTVLLSGCAGSLDELRALVVEPNDFDTALAAEYLGFSESQHEQGHPINAERFAAKGLKASHHEPVLPDMPGKKQEALMGFRKQLLAALTQDVKEVVPQKAARAQLLYDCWLLQEKEHGKEAPCNEEFLSAMNELQEVADEFIYGQELSHRVQFAPGSSELDEHARAQVFAIAEYVKSMENYVLLLSDHAPHTKAAQQLADRRMQAMRAAFMRAGVADQRIKRNRRDGAKEVLLSSDVIEHNAIDIEVRTKPPGGQ